MFLKEYQEGIIDKCFITTYLYYNIKSKLFKPFSILFNFIKLKHIVLTISQLNTNLFDISFYPIHLSLLCSHPWRPPPLSFFPSSSSPLSSKPKRRLEIFSPLRPSRAANQSPTHSWSATARKPSSRHYFTHSHDISVWWDRHAW